MCGERCHCWLCALRVCRVVLLMLLLLLQCEQLVACSVQYVLLCVVVVCQSLYELLQV